MIAQTVNMAPGDFIHTFGDVHIYLDQIELFKKQLTRDVRLSPRVRINPEVTDIFSFKVTDFTLLDYDPHPSIPYPVAI